jgi:hypothetical protein
MRQQVSITRRCRLVVATVAAIVCLASAAFLVRSMWRADFLMFRVGHHYLFMRSVAGLAAVEWEHYREEKEDDRPGE